MEPERKESDTPESRLWNAARKTDAPEGFELRVLNAVQTRRTSRQRRIFVAALAAAASFLIALPFVMDAPPTVQPADEEIEEASAAILFNWDVEDDDILGSLDEPDMESEGGSV